MNISEESALVPTHTAKAFAAAGAELGNGTLPILKFSKAGEWVVGAEGMPVTEPCFAVDAHGTQRGFRCWIGGSVVDQAMVPVALGKVISPDDLADHGPYERGDGWVECVSIQLRGLESGEEYIYSPTSHGGLEAVGRLLKSYGYRLESGKGGVPIVELGASSYKHKDYGTVFKPVLKIVSWRDEVDLNNDNAADLMPETRDEDIPF